MCARRRRRWGYTPALVTRLRVRKAQRGAEPSAAAKIAEAVYLQLINTSYHYVACYPGIYICPCPVFHVAACKAIARARSRQQLRLPVPEVSYPLFSRNDTLECAADSVTAAAPECSEGVTCCAVCRWWRRSASQRTEACTSALSATAAFCTRKREAGTPRRKTKQNQNQKQDTASAPPASAQTARRRESHVACVSCAFNHAASKVVAKRSACECVAGSCTMLSM